MISTRTQFRNACYALTACAVMVSGVLLAFAAITANAATTAATTATKTSTASSSTSSPSLGYTLGTLPDSVVYNDFVVGPGKIEIDLNPGESRTVELTIANRLGTEKTFNVTEEDFVGSDNLNQPVVLLGDDRSPYSLKDFVHIPASAVPIPHAEKAFIPVTISIPANAQPGGLYGSVIVSVATRQGSTTSPDNGSTATNPIITRLATLFFVRVAGQAKEEGKLMQFTLAGGRRWLFDNSPINFDLIFKNTGDVFLVPNGAITVTNMLGSSVGAVTVDPWFAMPQSLRFREVIWTPPFLFGRYKAHVTVERGYASTTDEMELTFWVIPWKAILAVFIGLTIVIFIIRWIFRHFKFVSTKNDQ